MADIITFMQVIGNLLVAAVIFTALIFTTVYYILGYLVKEIKLTPFIRKGINLKRR